ncbi:MAG: FAD-dependent oxidoreductase, partial [Cypionkella sp.]
AGRGLGVHRAALFDVLHDAVVAAGIAVRTSSEIVTLRDVANGKRALVFIGDQQSEGFDLIVDCLGSNSPLKGHSRAPGKSRPLAFGAVWATLPWHEEGFDPAALLQRYRAASIMVGILPIGQRRDGAKLGAFFWSLRVADYAALKAGGLQAWKAAVLENWPETAPYLDEIDSFDAMTLARYAHHTMDDPTGDALAFVGDSAHSTSPQLGQGANMALLDARALYVGLRDNGDDLDAALAHYGGLRRGHVRLYQALSAMFTPFYQSDSRVLPVIRDVFVSLLARIPPAPQFLAAMVSGSLLSPIKKLGLEQPPRF